MAKTKQEIRVWLDRQVGQSIAKTDGGYQGQCVSLIQSLLAFLGASDGKTAMGNAKDFGDALVSRGIAKNGDGWLRICVNRQMGWGYGHVWCLPTDITEVLTPSGWKMIKDFSVGDDVYQYNKDSGAVEATKVLSTVTPYIDTVLVGAKFEATSDHRMLVKSYTGNVKETTLGEVAGKSYFIPRISGGIVGDNDITSLSNDELAFLIAVQADGSHEYTTKDGVPSIRFHLKKTRKIERLEAILTKLGYKYTKTSSYEGRHKIYVSSIVARELCRDYIPNKSFSKDWWFLTKEQADFVSIELTKWDGRVRGNAYEYFNDDEESITNIQVGLSVNGIRASVKGDDGHYRMSTRGAYNYTLCGEHAVRDAEVSCISVESTYIVVRQNGEVFITGNCDLQNETNYEQNGARALVTTKGTRPISQAQQIINLDQYVNGDAPAPAPQPAPSGAVAQIGTFQSQVNGLRIRRSPSMNGAVVGKFDVGGTVKYDSYVDAEGYRWVSWIGNSGNRNYTARRTLDNKTIFGKAF